MRFRHLHAGVNSYVGCVNKIIPLLALLSTICWPIPISAQIAIEDAVVIQPGDTAYFWLQVPANYSPSRPPAIMVWWHQFDANHREMVGNAFSTVANARGWILACHAGPADPVPPPYSHYNTARAQLHCRVMLDWIAANYPFHLDSIYMIGGSMGGAGGIIWHNNNCGSDDYLIAATAGASQILDCHFRQDQYLAQGDTNRAMRLAFGGLPCERDSVAFEYHRASAIFIRGNCDGDPSDLDTSESMHYNSLHLPVWITWGADPSERERYGLIAAGWDSLRRALGADTTWIAEASTSGHGAGLMGADSICQWLSGFSANRYPDDLSISADEDDDYYWTKVSLTHNDTVFGRYGAHKDFAARRLDLTLVRNVSRLCVNFTFPWPQWDSLWGDWVNLERNGTPATLEFSNIPTVYRVYCEGTPVAFTYEEGRLSIVHEQDGRYTVLFEPSHADASRETPVPSSARLVAVYPNPSNSQFIIEIEVPHALRTAIDLFDETGRRAKTLTVALTEGLQNVPVSAHGLPSGLYFAHLRESNAPPLRIVLIR